MLNAYCIKDSATGTFQRPFFCTADGEATRMFQDLVGEKEHPVGKHPGDYAVWSCGRFDEDKGVMLPDDVRCLCTGSDILRMEKGEE